MKRFFYLAMLAALAVPAAAQQCVLSFNLTTTASSPAFNNLTRGCVDWTITFNSTGFTGLTLTVQTAPNNAGVPGAWSTFTAATGSNPSTATTQASATFSGYFPFVRVTLSGLTGTGTVSGLLYGTWTASGGGGGGSGCPDPCPVVGPAASGAALSGAPVRVGLSDTVNVQDWLTASSLADAGTGAGAGAVAGLVWNGTGYDRIRGNTGGINVQLRSNSQAGADGVSNTLVQPADDSGVSIVVRAFDMYFNGTTWDRMRGNTLGMLMQGSAANGAVNAAAGNPLRICGMTGGGVTGVCTSIRVGSQGSLELQGSAVGLADALSNTVTLPSYDGAAGGSARSLSFLFNGTTWDRLRGSAAAGLITGGFSTGAANTYYGTTNCDSSAVVNVAAGATTELVSLTAARSVRVCSFVLSADTAASTATFVQGTGANCGTGTAGLTGAMAMGAASNITVGNGVGELFKTTAANALCLTAATGTITGVVTFAKF